jgi:hypothetical protein
LSPATATMLVDLIEKQHSVESWYNYKEEKWANNNTT